MLAVKRSELPLFIFVSDQGDRKARLYSDHFEALPGKQLLFAFIYRLGQGGYVTIIVCVAKLMNVTGHCQQLPLG